MAAMAQDDKMPNMRERILLALWKLKGIGKNAVEEEAIRAELNAEISRESWANEIELMYQQGFLDKSKVGGKTAFSLTPLGLAILRQIEENHLQELK